jgi:hypothetical protein
MKKNTEKIGSIFDPQPSELSGNIQCVSDPSETVVGFISCGLVREKRIFIKPSEILKINDDWFFRPNCFDMEIPKFQLAGYHQVGYLIVEILDPAGNWLKIAPGECVDCRFYGSNIKPSYWPQ